MMRFNGITEGQVSTGMPNRNAEASSVNTAYHARWWTNGIRSLGVSKGTPPLGPNPGSHVGCRLYRCELTWWPSIVLHAAPTTFSARCIALAKSSRLLPYCRSPGSAVFLRGTNVMSLSDIYTWMSYRNGATCFPCSCLWHDRRPR